jgi:phosphoglucosamine mutase
MTAVPRLFGTDGVRGVANVDLTPELALALAAAAVAELPGGADGRRPLAVVGRDPRPSGELLEAAVVSGLLSAGADVLTLGIVPTPAVAYALTTPMLGEVVPDLGVVISASHNPMPDNGIKFFGPGGVKLGDDVEDRIEARSREPGQRPVGAAVGRVRADRTDDTAWYVEHLTSTVDVDLTGLRIVVDCANGAAATVAPAAYRAAGAHVHVINDDRTGYRINDGCGATHLEPLRRAVVDLGAALGLAHDGDADRCLAVDADGNVVDGDQILAVLAVAMQEHGTLAADTVVATVMSNQGFRTAMANRGITFEETPVGDRYVTERMRAGGFTLGGEQSGHVILADHATTGDGVLTGLHLLARVAQTQRSLADLAGVMTKLPQFLVNVRVADKDGALATLEPLAEQAAADLGSGGRVLVRPSGTEPVVRVMVEAPTHERAQDVAERLADAVR